MLIRSPRRLVLALALALIAAPGAAHAGTVTSDGVTATYVAAAGQDDVIRVTAGPTITALPEGTATVTPGTGCAPAGANAVSCAGSSRVNAVLGDGNDGYDGDAVGFQQVVDGGEGADVVVGGSGADSLTGGPGPDVLDGLSGADGLFALDGTPDRLLCSGGTAEFDSFDAVTGCAGAPNATFADADGDGAPAGQDCDDSNPMVYAGAPDLPSNNVDEDCDGVDDVILDVDGDGYNRPDDCNDRNPNIKPNAVEKRGNRIDENCDGRLQDFFPMDVLVTNSWAYSASQTRVNRMIVRGAPKRAKITVRCKGRGCRFKSRRRTVSADNRGEDVTRFFRRTRLRPGATVRIDVKAANFISVRVTFKVRSLDIPSLKRTCREGNAKAKPC
jgi:Putative metal-binding motif/RTX calcium-binding nonapeptide repeat (4 copies)